MKITTPDEYTDAIDKANRLRGRGYSAECCPELAVLDASIHAYEQLPDQPGDTPGKPAYHPPQHKP